MSTIYEVKITTQAQKHLLEIFDYISLELLAPDAANNLLAKMENSIMSLSEFPERYQLIDEEPWKSEGIRKIVVNNFLIYYWINKNSCIVYVTAVIYHKKNQLEELKNMNFND